MQRLTNPLPIWLDSLGELLYGGSIYIGVAGQDPEVHPIIVYWDAALAIPATQPLTTRGGVIVNGGDPAAVFISQADYSVRVYDADGNVVSYSAKATNAGGSGGEIPDYQPLDDDLTAIAEQGTAPFGRSLLACVSAVAVKTLLGIANALSTAGGIVTGNIVRSGSGPHLYHADATLTSGKVFITADGAADPTSAPGDVWLAY